MRVRSLSWMTTYFYFDFIIVNRYAELSNLKVAFIYICLKRRSKCDYNLCLDFALFKSKYFTYRREYVDEDVKKN